VDARGSQQIAGGIALPILGGPLRGLRWLPASGGKLARLLLGSYEREQARRFAACLRAGDAVIDVGAAAGFYALLAARHVGASGRVVACEPDATNLGYLRAHAARNAFPQIEILACALSDHTGRAQFAIAGSGRGRLHASGGVEVALRTIDDIANERALRARCIKLDVEGAELEVLCGGRRTLRAHKPLLFLSTHDRQNPGVEARCCGLLAELGYEIERIGPGELVCSPGPMLAAH
jgi:FkbM family methyltransferase